MNENSKNDKQTKALMRFQAISYVLDQMRNAKCLAQGLREASLRPWPDENGDFYTVRGIEDWYYAYKNGGFAALQNKPRTDRGTHRVLTEDMAAWIPCTLR